MIYYVCTRPHAYTLAVLLIYWRPDLRGIVRFLPHDRLSLISAIKDGVVIWTDFDRLGVKECDAAAEARDRLQQAQPGVLQLTTRG